MRVLHPEPTRLRAVQDPPAATLGTRTQLLRRLRTSRVPGKGLDGGRPFALGTANAQTARCVGRRVARGDNSDSEEDNEAALGAFYNVIMSGNGGQGTPGQGGSDDSEREGLLARLLAHHAALAGAASSSGGGGEAPPTDASEVERQLHSFMRRFGGGFEMPRQQSGNVSGQRRSMLAGLKAMGGTPAWCTHEYPIRTLVLTWPAPCRVLSQTLTNSFQPCKSCASTCR